MKRPENVELNSRTYRWLASKKLYKSDSASWFLETYPIFSNSGAPESISDFYKLIAYAYSWMPTIPSVKRISPAKWRRITEFLPHAEVNQNDLQKLLYLLVPIINNSIVGTSKVLHFINPESFPILDSRIYKNWNRIFKSEYKLPAFIGRPTAVQINAYITYHGHLKSWKHSCGNRISLRKLELVLYSQKIRK